MKCSHSKFYNLIWKVQKDKNWQVEYVPDKEQYGVNEYWVGDEHLKAGDCEDFALCKLFKLMSSGLPEESMGIATCFVDGDPKRGHAVLIVSTDKGDFVLDNRFNDVLPWKDIPDNYKWNYIPPNVRD